MELQDQPLSFSETADIETSSAGYAARFAGPVGRWMLDKQLAAVRDLLVEKPYATILDVGGGHGQLAPPLAEAGYDVTVLGSADVCADPVREGLEKGILRFETGNVIDLPFPDDSFDVVLCFRLVTHCQAWQTLISELCRVARKAVIIDYPTNASVNAIAPALFGAKKKLEGNTRVWRLFSRSELKTVFGGAGFEAAGSRKQFFFPMVLHRMMKQPWLSGILEGVARLCGLTSVLGSPVVARYEPMRQDVTDKLDPRSLSGMRVAVTIPHIDDGVLGCGGLILQIPDKSNIHFIYACDGKALPAGSQSPPHVDLGALRREEALAATEVLGIPRENVHFLDYPDWHLKKHASDLDSALNLLFDDIQPTHVFTPFRYDRHPDHITLSAHVRRKTIERKQSIRLFEYFIYYHWKLLPMGDIRKYIRSHLLIAAEIDRVSADKRHALSKFVSQVTVYYEQQHKPVLGEDLLDEFSRGPELFLRPAGPISDRNIFTIAPCRVRLVHALEPRLKNFKEQVLSLLQRLKNRIQ
ncbi:MAG: PIG-L family deacetylase [Verrucomicrobia bacterium]|nr:PIG-L family deacetylase [Verrucomicrobiota bacterium]